MRTYNTNFPRLPSRKPLEKSYGKKLLCVRMPRPHPFRKAPAVRAPRWVTQGADCACARLRKAKPKARVARLLLATAPKKKAGPSVTFLCAAVHRCAVPLATENPPFTEAPKAVPLFVPLSVPLPAFPILFNPAVHKVGCVQCSQGFDAVLSKRKRVKETAKSGILSPVRLPFRHTGNPVFIGVFARFPFEN